MNLIDYDGLINYFTDLSQECFKEAKKWENRYDTYYLLGKTAAYLGIANTLTKLKNGGRLSHEKDSNG